jgi:hypothetical protein
MLGMFGNCRFFSDQTDQFNFSSPLFFFFEEGGLVMLGTLALDDDDEVGQQQQQQQQQQQKMAEKTKVRFLKLFGSLLGVSGRCCFAI